MDIPEPNKKRKLTDDSPSASENDKTTNLGSTGPKNAFDPYLNHEMFIFVIGPQKTKVMASATILRNISQWIHNELNKVQATESNVSMPEIQLPESDPDAVRILCSLVCSTRQPEYDSITTAQFLALALLAVKFDCADRLFYSVEYYFSRLGNLTTPESLWNAYTASYFFRKSKHFQRYSIRLASSYHGSFLPFIHLFPDATLALRLCLALEERRYLIRSGTTSVPGALCVECFDRAMKDFLPNQNCKACLVWGRLPPTVDKQESKASANLGLPNTNPFSFGGLSAESKNPKIPQGTGQSQTTDLSRTPQTPVGAKSRGAAGRKK